MKKIFLLPLLAMSSGAFANYYIGAEYGYTTVDQDYSTTFTASSITVKPNGKSDTLGLFVGYRVSNSLGWELGYTQYDAEDSHSRYENVTSSGIHGARQTEWEAELEASQFTIKPVYFMPLGHSLSLKTGLGLSLTKYKYRSRAHREIDTFLGDIELGPLPGGEKKDDTVIGGVASIGLDYNLTNSIALGASAQYQFDKIAKNSSLKLSAVYSF